MNIPWPWPWPWPWVKFWEGPGHVLQGSHGPATVTGTASCHAAQSVDVGKSVQTRGCSRVELRMYSKCRAAFVSAPQGLCSILWAAVCREAERHGSRSRSRTIYFSSIWRKGRVQGGMWIMHQENGRGSHFLETVKRIHYSVINRPQWKSCNKASKCHHNFTRLIVRCTYVCMHACIYIYIYIYIYISIHVHEHRYSQTCECMHVRTYTISILALKITTALGFFCEKNSNISLSWIIQSVHFEWFNVSLLWCFCSCLWCCDIFIHALSMFAINGSIWEC